MRYCPHDLHALWGTIGAPQAGHATMVGATSL